MADPQGTVQRFGTRATFTGSQPQTTHTTVAGGNAGAAAPPPPGMQIDDQTIIAPPGSQPVMPQPGAGNRGSVDYDPTAKPANYGSGSSSRPGMSPGKRLLLAGTLVTVGVGGGLALTGHLPAMQHMVPHLSAPAHHTSSAPAAPTTPMPPADTGSQTGQTAPAGTAQQQSGGLTINGFTYATPNAPPPAQPGFTSSSTPSSYDNHWTMNSQMLPTFQDMAYQAPSSMVSNIASQFANSATNPAGVWVRGLDAANPQSYVHVSRSEMLADATQNGPLTQALFGPSHTTNVVVGPSADSPTVTFINLN
jgi:hypothetical protein